ncbi:MAG: peptide chain release factor-like protein [Planctomycetota bacterium]|nr:MAG: peptide chain release factor-like protein [Planctomycetota bacterium]
MTDAGDGQEIHPACLPEEKLLCNCEVHRTRRSGPGGQHRNKVETAIVLTHRPTGIRAEASERRRQADNQRVALRRLRVNLALEHRSTHKAQHPSQLWRERCRGGKLHVSADHADFPSVLSEALDLLESHDWNIPPAAERLGCTSSQLVNLLRKEPRALSLVNAKRRSRELRPLR